MNLSNQIIKEKLLDDSSVLEFNSQETLNNSKDNNFVDEPSLDVTRKVSFQLSFEEKNLDKNTPFVPKKEENLINQELLDGLSNKELKEIISHIQLRRDSPALINIDQMASVLNDASPELAAEILRGIDWAHASQIIAKIRDRTAVGNLYRLSPGAEGLMKAEVVGMRSEWPISHALSVLRKSGLKSADLQNLFVVDKGGLLLGSIDLPDLVFSDPRKHVRDVMSINVVSVELGTDREHCARLMETHGLRAIPVVNKSGILQGVISIEELVQVAEDEATEDMFKMVGMSIQD
ncbi:MAG TPA: CBS domain-containing protein, partial [Dehalococcoidia bacterium]|nr:CBS domain-containing protein [Dehalococcoidia bacterium]